MNKLKKISILTLGIVGLLGTCVLAKTGTIEDATSGLVFRKTASKGGEPITTLYNGTSVEILAEEGEWYKVKYGESEGYLFAEYVKVNEESAAQETKQEEQETVPPQEQATDPAEPADEISTSQKTVKLTGETKIYIMPLVTSSVIATAKAEGTVTVEKETGNFAYVTYGNKKGWVRLYNLSNETTANSQTEEEKPTEEKTGETQSAISYGYVNDSSVNVRKEPNTSSEIITILTLNTGVDIVGQTDEWYKITYGEYTGYIAKHLISETATTTSRSSDQERKYSAWEGYVSVGIANIREEASTNSKIIETLKQKAKIEIIGEDGDFYKINLNGKTAYIAKNLVVNSLDKITDLEKTNTTANTTSNTPVANTMKSNSNGENIVNFAKQYLGYNYVYGGTTPSGGFDCSGFVYYVFNSCGYNLSRSCSVQARSGVAVSKSELQPGDIVFFNNTSDGSIGHVGIYIGEGRFIHAANASRGIVTDTLNSGYYYAYYYSARRITK